jgi:hypothetical protein
MATLEIELLPEEQARLRAEADRECLPLADWARHRLLASEPSLEEILRAAREATYDSTAKPIWEIAAEIGGRIPPEEKARMPHDGSINFKHYGTAKFAR